MSVILNQSESEDQQGQPVTEVTTVIGGDLTIPAGTQLTTQGWLRLEGTLTIEDGGGVTISQPPAMHRVFSRQDALRSLAEDSLQIGSLTRPPDNTVQRMIELGDLSREVNAMIALGDLSAGALTLQKNARLIYESSLAQTITTGKQVFMTELAAAAAAAAQAAEAMRRMIEPTVVGASIEAVRRMIEPTVQSFAEQHRQMMAAALAGTSFTGLHAGGDAWRAPAVLAPEPARQPVQQPQPVIIEVVQVAPSDWKEVLAAALREGRASPEDVIRLVQHLPEQKPTEWAVIETAVAIYKERGHRYENQAGFVMHLASKGISISVPTFQRWLRKWEMSTGERVRPGRGNRKQRSI